MSLMGWWIALTFKINACTFIQYSTITSSAFMASQLYDAVTYRITVPEERVKETSFFSSVI